MTPEELDRLDALLSDARQVDGCSDHGCVLRIFLRGGMGTNGGCHCVGRDDADGMIAVRAARLDLTRLLALARQTPTLVAEVRRLRTQDNPEFDATDGAHPAWWRGHDCVTERWRERVTAVEAERDALRAEVEGLRALVAHLTPPEPTPLTDTQRAWLDALLSAHTGPGAVCEHSPASDVTRRELVEAEAAARALGDSARARVASMGLRVYSLYDRERDRVHEVSAILEAAREALGCETWSEVPAEVERLRALLAPR